MTRATTVISLVALAVFLAEIPLYFFPEFATALIP